MSKDVMVLNRVDHQELTEPTHPPGPGGYANITIVIVETDTSVDDPSSALNAPLEVS
jgi:acetoacetate decarboxylase